MKQKLLIFLVLVLMAVALIGLNAASYSQREKPPDSESMPNRSTFNAGATGLQAFYSLLSETGRKVVRWQQSPAGLMTARANKPSVFVIAGRLRREFTDPEVEQLLRWVAEGGRLVILDREPPPSLITTTANWKIEFKDPENLDYFAGDPTDQKAMVGDTQPVKPVQPSVLTQNVNTVQPSRYATSVGFTAFSNQVPASVSNKNSPPPPRSNRVEPIASPSLTAPITHFAYGDKNFVVDAPFGSGRIIFVSDPYVVSNSGISLADNMQLAINLVSAGDGIVAFDEFHQGFGAENNRFLQFFAGTPVIPIFLQSVLLVALVFFSQSRRFARPVPEPESDRLSKLEYVSAMAELQGRTRSYDLAIENIYSDFRRRAARYFGLDNYTAKSGDIAAQIAERTGMDRRELDEMLFQCEEIIRGEPTNKKEVVRLIDALRSIEQKLGMTRIRKTRV